jgi:hypothetical protein
MILYKYKIIKLLCVGLRYAQRQPTPLFVDWAERIFAKSNLRVLKSMAVIPAFPLKGEGEIAKFHKHQHRLCWISHGVYPPECLDLGLNPTSILQITQYRVFFCPLPSVF